MLDADSNSTSIESNLQTALDLSFSNAICTEDKNATVKYLNMLSWHKCIMELFELQCTCLEGTLLGRNKTIGRNNTWLKLVAGTALGRNRGLVHVGGSHSTWQGRGSCNRTVLGRNMEHDLAHVGGRHNTLLAKGHTDGLILSKKTSVAVLQI